MNSDKWQMNYTSCIHFIEVCSKKSLEHIIHNLLTYDVNIQYVHNKGLNNWLLPPILQNPDRLDTVESFQIKAPIIGIN